MNHKIIACWYLLQHILLPFVSLKDTAFPYPVSPLCGLRYVWARCSLPELWVCSVPSGPALSSQWLQGRTCQLNLAGEQKPFGCYKENNRSVVWKLLLDLTVNQSVSLAVSQLSAPQSTALQQGQKRALWPMDFHRVRTATFSIHKYMSSSNMWWNVNCTYSVASLPMLAASPWEPQQPAHHHASSSSYTPNKAILEATSFTYNPPAVPYVAFMVISQGKIHEHVLRGQKKIRKKPLVRVNRLTCCERQGFLPSDQAIHLISSTTAVCQCPCHW